MKKWLLMLIVILIASGAYYVHAARGKKKKEVYKSGSMFEYKSDLLVGKSMSVRKAVVIKGNMQVYGKVAKDVVAINGNIHLGPNAEVWGDVVAINGKINRVKGSVVKGDIVEMKSFIGACRKSNCYTYKLTFFGVLLIIAILTGILLPKPLNKVSGYIENEILKVIKAGAIGAVAVIPIAAALVVSGVGILLLPVLLSVLLIMHILGFVAVIRIVGIRIFLALKRSNKSLMLEIIAGFALCTILTFVPVLGFAITVIITFTGFGGALLAANDYVKSRKTA